MSGFGFGFGFSPHGALLNQMSLWETMQFNLVTEGHSFMARGYWDLRVNTNVAAFYNSSASGATISTIEGKAATVDSKLVAETDSLKNILALWIGVNDVPNTAGAAATCYTALKSYVQARVTAGWKVFVYTMTPSTYLRYSVFEAERVIFNGLLRSDLKNIAGVYIVDTDTDSRFNDTTDKAYYEDTLHPTGTGLIIANQLFDTKLRSVYKLAAPTITVGSEVVDQTAWCHASHAFWDNYFQTGWSADGTKLSCSTAGNATISRLSALSPGKLYKVTMDVTVTSGYLQCAFDGTNPPPTIWETGVITYYMLSWGATPRGLSITGSGGFVGSINSLSIKYANFGEVPSTITDADGNTYTEIVIGTQTWLVENLKTTKFANGEAIANVTDNLAWAALTTPAYAWHSNDIANKTPYGALYNHFVLDDKRLVAPFGYHPATKEDFDKLVAYLGGAAVAGGKLKEDGTSHWTADNADNASGFTAVGATIRSGSNGTFSAIKSNSLLWTNTKPSSTPYEVTLLATNAAATVEQLIASDFGASIRCLKD